MKTLSEPLPKIVAFTGAGMARDSGFAPFDAERMPRGLQLEDVVTRDGGAQESLGCDVITVSGGYSPAVHLFSHVRGSLKYDAALASFLPVGAILPIVPAQDG